MPIDTNLTQRLLEADEKYSGDEMVKIFGPSLLTWTSDSSRMYMFTSHLKQTLTLLNPEVPRLQTGFENSFGKKNRAYKQLQGTWEVKAVIPKFTKLKEVELSPTNQIIMLVLYNKKTDTYDMIEKVMSENLTEKFGYVYNTDYMDSLKVGDKITDPILYKSTSYDDHMNYRYGKNANVYYSTSSDTIEDAIPVRKGWAESIRHVEVDKVQVMLNNNDIILNLYGDSVNYKPFPHIGEKVVDSTLCATRQINKHRLLFDFQKSHMREVYDSDVDYFVSKNSVVYDIDVYYNGEEDFPDNIFNSMLKEYYECGKEYARNIMEYVKMIKKSGSKYTVNVSHNGARYQNYNDRDYKWTNKENKAFNNILVEFKVRAEFTLELGSKLAGRYANKGVVSQIIDTSMKDDLALSICGKDASPEDIERTSQSIEFVDDERMPYYEEDGKRVYADIMLNTSGAIRRLNSSQIMETETNFIAEQIRYRIKKCDTRSEKIELMFKFLDCLNTTQSTFFRKKYEEFDSTKKIGKYEFRLYSDVEKDAFIKDVEDNGFYIVRPPHNPILLDDVINLYDTFPEITPKDIKIDLFGIRNRTVVRKGIIGYQYMIILKQNSNKNFSARSTFRVNRSNLPVKDIAKKTNRSSYARTPVRLSEIHNLLASVSAKDLAEWNIFTRSSAIGRKSLDRILSSSGNPFAITKLKIKDNYNNSNVDILNAKLKCMGLRIHLSSMPNGYIEVHDNSKSCSMKIGDYIIVDTPNTRGMYTELFDRFNKELSSHMFIEFVKGEKHDYCWNKVFEDKEVTEKYDLTEDQKIALVAATKGKHMEISQFLSKKIVQVDVDPDNEAAPKRRGRKSNAEKARIAAEIAKQQELDQLRFTNNLNDENDIIEDEEETEGYVEETPPVDYSPEDDDSEIDSEDL